MGAARQGGWGGGEGRKRQTTGCQTLGLKALKAGTQWGCVQAPESSQLVTMLVATLITPTQDPGLY